MSNQSKQTRMAMIMTRTIAGTVISGYTAYQIVRMIERSERFKKLNRSINEYAVAFVNFSELCAALSRDACEYVLEEDAVDAEGVCGDGAEEEERTKSSDGVGCSTSDRERERDGKKIRVYSKVMPRRIGRALEFTKDREVLEAASAFVANVLRKSFFDSGERNEMGGRDDSDSGSAIGGVRVCDSRTSGHFLDGFEIKMADFFARISETVLKTEESAKRFNIVFTNAFETVVDVAKKAVVGNFALSSTTTTTATNENEITEEHDDNNNDNNNNESSINHYSKILDIALSEIEKRKKFLFDLLDCGVRAFVSENQRNEANPFNDVMKALETNPMLGFKLIDAVATKVVETYVAETHKSGFVSEMARQSNKRRGPRSQGSVADLPAEEFRASASFAMENRLAAMNADSAINNDDDDDDNEEKIRKKTGSPKTPLDRASAAAASKRRHEHCDASSDDSGDVPDQTPRFNGFSDALPPRPPNSNTASEIQHQHQHHVNNNNTGNFRTFEGELAKDLFDVMRATPNSRKFAVEMAAQCVRSATSAFVFAIVDVIRNEIAKIHIALLDWIQTGPVVNGVVDIRASYLKRAVYILMFALFFKIIYAIALGNDTLS
jgi:uncharacterized membrane protein YkoI